MAADDEFEALESLKKFEELSQSPVTTGMGKMLELIIPVLNGLLPPGAQIPNPVMATGVGALKYWLNLRRARSDKYNESLLNALHRQQLRMEAGQLKRTDEDIEYIKEKLMPLIVDGYDRAQQIPSEARIQRLAEVVVSGLWSRHSEDERREIMRIVGDVDELDAVLLGHLYRRRRELEQGSGVAGTGINVKYFVSTGVVTDGDVANSGLLKLQSLGLVIAQSNGFRLLTRGKTFLILTGLVQPEEDA